MPIIDGAAAAAMMGIAVLHAIEPDRRWPSRGRHHPCSLAMAIAKVVREPIS